MNASISQMLQESAPATSIYNESYVGQLRKKWGKFLTGIKSEQKMTTMAVLFENQSNHLLSLTEDTRSTNVGSFLKFVLTKG